MKNELFNVNILSKICNSNLLNKLDPITYKHSINVARYASWFDNCIRNNANEYMGYYSGLLHDIGKMQIDNKILNKPSKLLMEEFNIVKKHPVIGCNILMEAGFPKEIVDAVHFHHEKYDGTGYPKGLKGDNIPLLARMISICDVFDALTTDRPYRKAHSKNEALQIMRRMDGHFDLGLLLIFIHKGF